MGKKKLNRKGFTLIELLAVIVILAILILLAMPSVLNIMENARKNALVTEAESIISAAKTRYAADAVGAHGSNATTCYKIKGGVLENYLDKDLSTYSGTVKIEITPGSGETESKANYFITLTNGTYKIENGEAGKIKADDVKASTDIGTLSGCTDGNTK